MKTFWFVYIITSKDDPSRHYTGVTQELGVRLSEHNRGSCRFTALHRPWAIETSIAFRSEEKARTFERYLKTGSGRQFARRHL